jgi:NADH:ubiquinone oxidoreductase subunit F (NADH-binding)/ferredoxin
MDRRMSETTDRIQFRIDATRCDGQGVCVLIAPEIFQLDRYGLGYVVPGSAEVASGNPDVRGRGLEADAMCPRSAIRSEVIPPAPPPAEAVGRPQTKTGITGRLLTARDRPETREDWAALGGFGERTPAEVRDLAEAAGLTGQGGAAFLSAQKWTRLSDGDVVVVANGAEREPGTVKDRYLLARRPFLVLDGLRLAMSATAANLGIVAVDENSELEAAQLSRAIERARAAGDFGGAQIRVERIPARYVAGEETALLNVIEGGSPLPRLRPPYPTDRGVFGRPTLVHNVETLAHLALAAALGPEEYRRVGTPEAPGSGLFSVGRFGGPFELAERSFGYPLRDLLAECGMLSGTRAALVGGFAGALLTPDSFGIGLSPGELRAVGATLGTKSVQVLTADQCPVRAVAEVVEYFGAETAEQCPPCSRGLPDMAALLRGIESGGPGSLEAVKEIEAFMSTLPGRGVCRLPDGAARIVLSLMTGFADDVRAHVEGGCPIPDSSSTPQHAEKGEGGAGDRYQLGTGSGHGKTTLRR